MIKLLVQEAACFRGQQSSRYSGGGNKIHVKCLSPRYLSNKTETSNLFPQHKTPLTGWRLLGGREKKWNRNEVDRQGTTTGIGKQKPCSMLAARAKHP